MFLRISPEYRRVWAEAIEQYLPTTEIIGYRAETFDNGIVLAFGKTRAEAMMAGMLEFARLQKAQIRGQMALESKQDVPLALLETTSENEAREKIRHEIREVDGIEGTEAAELEDKIQELFRFQS